MQKELALIRELDKAFGFHYSDSPDANIPAKFREELIKFTQEEMDEVVKAMREEPIENIAKELADLITMVLGTIDAYGLKAKFPEIFAEVHRSNMSKLDEHGKPVFRADGKIAKLATYKPADIKKIIDN